MKRSLLTHNNIKLPDFKIEDEINFLNEESSQPWSFDQYGIPDYWVETKGEGIKVLVLDTGKPNHTDLKDNNFFFGNWSNEIDDSDLNGHQTHCNGIIGGKKTGVAPLCEVHTAKVLRKNGSGDYRSLIKALESAAKSDFDIISLSLGGSNNTEELEYVINKLTNSNKIVVCAAGNSGSGGVNYPAKYKNTIAVAAHDEQSKITYFSSKGTEVDFAAPGFKILSTYLNQSYAKLSGTSMACPFIVGLIALMLSKHRKEEAKGKYNNCRTPEQVYQHLQRCSIDYGEVGKDSSYGHGLIDAKLFITGEKNNKPDPEPKPDSWIKRNLAWVVCGTFIIIAIIFYLTSLIQSTTEVYVPYIDEDGNVDWDKKFEEENNKK